MNDSARKSNWQEHVLQMCSFPASASLPAGLFANCEQEFQIARFPQRGQNSFVSRHSMQPARAQQPLHQGRKNESLASFLSALNYFFSSGICNYPPWLCIASAKTHQLLLLQRKVLSKELEKGSRRCQHKENKSKSSELYSMFAIFTMSCLKGVYKYCDDLIG